MARLGSIFRAQGSPPLDAPRIHQPLALPSTLLPTPPGIPRLPALRSTSHTQWQQPTLPHVSRPRPERYYPAAARAGTTDTQWRMHAHARARLRAGPAACCRYPFMASLRDANGNHFCGGSLVAPGIVLTAAHCLDQDSADLRNPTVRPGLAPPMHHKVSRPERLLNTQPTRHPLPRPGQRNPTGAGLLLGCIS